MGHSINQVVTSAITLGGFGGLYNKFEPCGCKVGDLAPCGELKGSCRLAYGHTDPTDPEFWVMTELKTEPTEEEWARFRAEFLP